MVDLFLDSRCDIKDCKDYYEIIVDGVKYCVDHTPIDKQTLIAKKICKHCYIEAESDYVCKGCKINQCRKEDSIVRCLRKEFGNKFVHNTNEMVKECYNRRPDIFFELPLHNVVVEIDEEQHKRYGETCECVRISEIVAGIGSTKPITFIRYNPDSVHNKKQKVEFTRPERISLLVKIIKEELEKTYERFDVHMIQLYYDDDYDQYKVVKRETITDKVAI